jgi:hypothetical protein
MAIVDALMRLLFWGAIYLAAARVGGWLTRSSRQGVAHLAWDGLAGLAMVIAVWMTVGLFRFDRLTVVAVAVVLVGLALWRARGESRLRLLGEAHVPRSTVLACVVLALIVFIGLAWNRVPVLFFDSLAYHFAQPELWLIEGRIAPYEWSLHSWFPPGMSVLYGVGLALGGESWANDANLLIAVAFCLLAVDLGRRLFSPIAGLVALLALLSVPQVLFAAAIPAADLAHGTFVAATVAALLLEWREPEGGWLRCAGWLAAGAMLTKYLAIVMPLAVGGFLLLTLPGRQRRVGDAARFLLPSLLLLSPWMIQNWLVVGNPIAPLLQSLLPIEGLETGGDAAFRRDARGGLPQWSDLAALKPRLIGPAEGGIYPGPAWGLAVLSWIVTACVVSFCSKRVRLLTVTSLLLFATWFFTFRWERFLISTTLFICVAFAGSFWLAWKRGAVWRLAALALLFAGLTQLPTTISGIVRYSGAQELFIGRESAEQFVSRSWPQQRLVNHDGMQWDVDKDRILLVGEMRHFRLPVRRTAPTGFNRHPLVEQMQQGGSMGEVNAALRAAGFSHLLIDLDWVTRSAEQYPSLRWLGDHPDEWAGYLQSLGQPLVAEGRRAIFELPQGGG